MYSAKQRARVPLVIARFATEQVGKLTFFSPAASAAVLIAGRRHVGRADDLLLLQVAVDGGTAVEGECDHRHAEDDQDRPRDEATDFQYLLHRFLLEALGRVPRPNRSNAFAECRRGPEHGHPGFAATPIREDAALLSAIARKAHAPGEPAKRRHRVALRACDEQHRAVAVVGRQRVDDELEADRERERLVRLRAAEGRELVLGRAARRARRRRSGSPSRRPRRPAVRPEDGIAIESGFVPVSFGPPSGWPRRRGEVAVSSATSPPSASRRVQWPSIPVGNVRPATTTRARAGGSASCASTIEFRTR